MRDSLPRRDALLLAGSLALAGLPSAADATAESTRAILKQLLRDRTPLTGRIRLTLPQIAENGATVPLGVAVDSPMSAADHVSAIHILAESNPETAVLTVRFTPMSGKAAIATRIRLAQSQNVWAVAEMSDGSVAVEKAEVKVTIGGCGG